MGCALVCPDTAQSGLSDEHLSCAHQRPERSHDTYKPIIVLHVTAWTLSAVGPGARCCSLIMLLMGRCCSFLALRTSDLFVSACETSRDVHEGVFLSACETSRDVLEGVFLSACETKM